MSGSLVLGSESLPESVLGLVLGLKLDSFSLLRLDLKLPSKSMLGSESLIKLRVGSVLGLLVETELGFYFRLRLVFGFVLVLIVGIIEV